MKNIYGILVAILILSAMTQMVSASGAKDYKCVNKATEKVPPKLPESVKVDTNIEKVPLCPEGQVPKSTVPLKFSDIYTKEAEEAMNAPAKETASCSSGRCYDWVYSRQTVYNEGIAAYLTQHNPAIDNTNGVYSTGNIYTTDGSSRVLVGWTKSKGDYTRLGTSWWRYGAVQDCGYYGCDFVQISSYYYPGMYLGETSYGIYYAIEYVGGNWWINYNGEWIGYYPGSLWSYGYTNGNEVVYRGGVVSTVPVTTTDMGNGLWSSNSGAAKISSQKYFHQYSYWEYANTMKTATTPSLYSVTSTGNDGMRYGGPGSTGASSSITVTAPNGGERWTRGTAKTITWTKTGSPGSYVRIDLLKGGSLNSVITYSTYNDGNFGWNIPSGQALGSDYRIRIKSTSSTVTDTSNSNFAIVSSSSPYIRVIAPNGGENWARGSTKLITWTYGGSPGANVRIQLYKGGALVRTISTGTPNDGSFSWPIPWSQAIGSDYKIKISSTTTSYNDWSNSNFRIS